MLATRSVAHTTIYRLGPADGIATLDAATSNTVIYLPLMDALNTNPDFVWYAEISSRQSCRSMPVRISRTLPALLPKPVTAGRSRFYEDRPAEDDRLLHRSRHTDLWPRTDEQQQEFLVHVRDFCPKVSYDALAILHSLSRYADEIDSDLAHARLGKMHAPASDWRWRWAHVRPMHFTECPIYSASSTRRCQECQSTNQSGPIWKRT